LNFISTQPLKYEELSPNIIVLTKKNDFRNLWQTKHYSDCINLVTELKNISGQADLNTKDIIDTQSNLNSRVLKEIICILGLNYSFFETKEKLINERLVDKRNQIAHGQYLEIDDSDFSFLLNAVQEMISEFKVQIIEAAKNKSFLLMKK
jgi:hypothetical protein